MNMRVVRVIGVCGLLVFSSFSCRKTQIDNSKVIASMGDEKITENYFKEILQQLCNDNVAKDIFTNPELRKERNRLLSNLLRQKSVIKFAKFHGLDKDLKAQLEVTNASANAYMQLLAERRSVPEPAEAQLKEFYNECVSRERATSQTSKIPTFEQIKDQLIIGWKNNQFMLVREQLLNEIKQKHPIVFDPEYQPDNETN